MDKVKVRIEVYVEMNHNPTPQELRKLADKAQKALDCQAYFTREWSASVMEG